MWTLALIFLLLLVHIVLVIRIKLCLQIQVFMALIFFTSSVVPEQMDRSRRLSVPSSSVAIQQ